MNLLNPKNYAPYNQPLHRRRPLQVHNVCGCGGQLSPHPGALYFHRPRQHMLSSGLRSRSGTTDSHARGARDHRPGSGVHAAALPVYSVMVLWLSERIPLRPPVGHCQPGLRGTPENHHRGQLEQCDSHGGENTGHRVRIILYRNGPGSRHGLRRLRRSILSEGQAPARGRMHVQRLRHPPPCQFQSPGHRGGGHGGHRQSHEVGRPFRGHKQCISGHETRPYATGHYGA